MTDPINIKDFQHTILNQVKLFNYDTSHNVLDFKKNPAKYNPFMSMTFAWQMQQFQKHLIKIMTTPLDIQAAYWDTWHQVFSPKGKE